MKEQKRTGLEIAIIGMNGKFPGADNIEEFWNQIVSGKELINYFTDDQLKKAGIDENLLNNPNYVKSRGVMNDIEGFDASYFGYTPSEALYMSPQMRIMHETVWGALENAGYNPFTYKGLIGLYAGTSSSAHWSALCEFSANNSKNLSSSMLTDKDQICTRISYNFNLRGPSILVQTACSTSLVAIHLACQALLSGECNIAIAGGLSISTNRVPGYLHLEGSIYSPDGHCRPFDSSAAGTVESEGVGIVVLKPLEDAINDRDTIHGIILGSAINNDGHLKVGYTAPSAKGQLHVIESALKVAEVDPDTITYVEAHGTATNIGDPIEIEALKMAFKSDKKNSCIIGSVKSNIGHLIEAAGVTGLIKSVLVLKYKIVPPTIHFKEPNPKIDFKNSPFYVNTELINLKKAEKPLRAAVSSFGIGGTNANVILEEAPEMPSETESNSYKLICLSGNSQNVLKNISANLSSYIKANPGIILSDIAYTLQTGRKHSKFRKSFVCENPRELVNILDSLNIQNTERIKKENEEPKVVFLFSGQGSQYVNMGLDLYNFEETFKKEFDFCASYLLKNFNYNIKSIIYPNENNSKTNDLINNTANTQPILFAFEYALAKLLMSWGITPSTMIGHSIGEYVAACISEVLSPEDALSLVYHRGQLMQSLPGGKMLSVPLSEEKLKNIIDPNISIAAVNSSNLCVVSGKESAIQNFVLKLKQNNIESRELFTSHAFHSYMMEPILAEFEKIVSKIKINRPRIPYISNLTGLEVSAEQIKSPKYWSAHIRNTVNFSNGISKLLENENSIFIEVGPGMALTTFVNQHNSILQSHTTVNLIKHPNEEVHDIKHLLNAVGKLWENNVNTIWENLYVNEQRKKVPLPSYPFEHKKYWIEGSISDFMNKSITKNSSRSLMQRNSEIEDWFYIPSWEQKPVKSKSSTIPKTKWLVFPDNLGIGNKIISRLELSGQDITVVNCGESFKIESGAKKYELSVNGEKDYLSLFTSLKEQNYLPDKILHLWNITKKEEPELENYTLHQNVGFYSLINIAKAIGAVDYERNVEIRVVSNNVHEITCSEKFLCPQKATLLGGVKIIPLEYPEIKCQSIDLALNNHENQDYSQECIQIINECLLPIDDEIVAFRSKNRWIPKLSPLRIDKNETAAFPVKENGTYLITGGFGGMGFTFTKYLAKEYKAKIAVIGRSDFPSREQWDSWLINNPSENNYSKKISAIRELEKNGSRIEYYKADVSDFNEMSSVKKDAITKLGKINGIIHTAGVIDFEGIIQLRTHEMNEKSFNSKVKGPLVLHKIFENTLLDFFVLFSSVDSLIYKMKFGQVGYNAGNNFLDVYAYYLRSKGINAITINWTDWLEVGMSLESAKYTAKKNKREFSYDYFVNELSFAPISPDEGKDVFKIALSNNFTRVAIGPSDLIGAVEYLKMYGAPEELQVTTASFDEGERPDVETEYLAPKNKVEQLILEKWQDLFGFKKIGVDDNFFDLGGDSLKGMTFINNFKEILEDVGNLYKLKCS